MPLDDGHRKSLARLKKKVRSEKAKSAKIKIEAETKRAARKKRRADNPPEELVMTHPEPVKPINSGDVMRLFKEETKKLIESKNLWTFKVPGWGPKQYAFASKLLDEFGPDLTLDAVRYFCQNWDSIVQKSRGRLDGVPTIALMYAMRERIFGAAQLEKEGVKFGSKKESDEYKGDPKAPKIGW